MKKLLVIPAVMAGVLAAHADESAFQASLTPDFAYKSRDTTINGFAVNLWGENEQHSFNLGIVNGSVGDSVGCSIGLVNYSETYTGAQFGVVNCSSKDYIGFQGGGVNVANNATGVQIGVVNYTESLKGVQIGLANIVNDNGWFDEFPSKLAKGFVFVNWSF